METCIALHTQGSKQRPLPIEINDRVIASTCSCGKNAAMVHVGTIRGKPCKCFAVMRACHEYAWEQRIADHLVI